jgi:hypothetical protein
MFPKEHGAYGQMGFPLVTALAIAGPSRAALLTAVTVIAVFLSHEPLLVLIGRRGVRAKREDGRRAAQWLTGSVVVAIVAGAGALWLAPGHHRWSFVLPLVPAALLALTVAADREKSAAGEIAAAVAFSCMAIPVGLTSGAALSTALAVAAAFATVFTAGILSVRVVILKVRRGGDPRGVRRTRLLLAALVAVSPAVLIVAASRAALPWTTLGAVAPGLLMATAFAIHPPAATRLRAVGWTLLSASATTAVILVVGLGG